MFPFCHDRLVALEYGRILHIILSSFLTLSSEAMGLHNNLVSSMIGAEDVVRRVLPPMNLTALWKGPTSASPKLP